MRILMVANTRKEIVMIDIWDKTAFLRGEYTLSKCFFIRFRSILEELEALVVKKGFINKCIVCPF